MKTVKLSKAEQEVILTALSEWKICEATCYCGYKTYLVDMCNEYKEDGTPRCRLKQIINSIEEKLERR